MAGLSAGLPIANCRLTAPGPGGAIVDAPDTYLLASDTSTPARLMGGVYSMVMGATAASVSDDDATYASISPHFSGRIGLTAAGPEINLGNVVSGHDYEFYIALVNYGNSTPQNSAYRLYSGVGSSGTQYRSQADVALAEGCIMDALGSVFAGPAAYIAGCSPVTFTATSTLINIRRGVSGAAAQVAMIGLRDVTAGGPVSSTNDLTCIFVG